VEAVMGLAKEQNYSARPGFFLLEHDLAAASTSRETTKTRRRS
jgi:hypothetical protein